MKKATQPKDSTCRIDYFTFRSFFLIFYIFTLPSLRSFIIAPMPAGGAPFRQGILRTAAVPEASQPDIGAPAPRAEKLRALVPKEVTGVVSESRRYHGIVCSRRLGRFDHPKPHGP